MERLFLPVILFMNKLRFSQKLVVISLIVIVPIIFITYLFISQNDNDINFNQKERYGVEYNTYLKNVIADVQKHRELVDAYLSGDETAKEKVIQLQSKIESDINTLDVTDKKLNKILVIDNKWQTAKEQWNDIKTKTFQMSKEDSYNIHKKLINETLLSLHSYVSDKSNLTLDPDLDSYYCMDVTMFREMPIIEKLNQAQYLATSLVENKNITADQRKQLIMMYVDIKTLCDTINSDMQIAIRENKSKNLQLIQPDIQVTLEETNKFLDLINSKMIDTENIMTTSAEVSNQGILAIDKNVDLYDKVSTGLDQLLNKRVDSYTNSKTMGINISILAVFVILYIFIGFTLSIIKSISSLKQTTLKLGDGDLTINTNLKTKDEFGEVAKVYDRMILTFRDMIGTNQKLTKQVAELSQKLAINIEQTTQASEQITMTIQSIAEGAELQVRSAENSTNAINEIETKIDYIANKCLNVNNTSENMIKDANNGTEMIHKVVQQMNSISNSVSELANSIKSLGEKSESISQTVEIIEGIASQTNLLALNAAIEAARAGENGKGFAVVADEVRKLAEQSTKSATEIDELNGEIHQDIQQVIQAMEKGNREVQSGINIVQKTGQAFEKILYSVENENNEIEKISSAAQTLEHDSKQVSTLVNKVVEIAKESVERSQNVAASTEEEVATMESIETLAAELSSMAKSLEQMIAQFKI